MSQIKLLNIDCMEYMRTVPDKYFDLAIVDPPYFDGPNKPGFYRNGKFSSTLVPAGEYGEMEYWDVPEESYFQELFRVSKDQIIWGANHFANRFNSSGPGWIVWDKQNGASSFADAELAYSSFDKAVRIYQYRWNGMIQGSHGDKRKNEKRIHPTQKPINLYRWILQNYAKPEFKILDTHLGSGSSAIAAHYFGVAEFVGTEKSKSYFIKAQERFNTDTAQECLFK